MFSKTLLAVSALIGSAFAQQQYCDEAARFGVLTFNDTIVLGQEVTMTANFTCARTFDGYESVWTDYKLVVPTSNNTGYQPDIYFARRDAPSNDIDIFNFTFDPTYGGFTYYPYAQYQIVLTTTRVAQRDISYGDTLITGGVIYPVTLVQPSN